MCVRGGNVYKRHKYIKGGNICAKCGQEKNRVEELLQGNTIVEGVGNDGESGAESGVDVLS